jgi:hypothetical protein
MQAMFGFGLNRRTTDLAMLYWSSNHIEQVMLAYKLEICGIGKG